MPCIVFGVADLDAEYERLNAAGVTFKSAPTKSDRDYEAVFDDGFGNHIQPMQA